MNASELISTNPARNYEEIGRVAISTQPEIEAAVRDAHKAFPAWRTLQFSKRIEYLKSFLEFFRSQVKEIAELQTKEMGKPLAASVGEVESAGEWLSGQFEIAEKMLQSRVLDQSDKEQTELHLEPYGVVAAVAPWNFPAYQMFLAIMQPLLAGNTVVFKHSEECPLTSQMIAQLLDKAKLPEGVFTCLFGDGSVGQYLMEQDVDLLYFTGSSRVGQQVYELAAKKFIPAALEMGGSSPGIVFEDAELKNSCDSIYLERFSNCGQVCSALKRLFVHSNIYDSTLEKLKDLVESQVIGDPLEPKTTVGPLVAKRQLDLLEEQVKDAINKGARIVAGGGRPDGLRGAFYRPTILTDVTPDMRVMKEEVFGPVLPIIPFEAEEKVIEMANDTPYGLTAYVYTEDINRANRIAKQLEAGQVSINGANYLSKHAPFGGYKKSGIGRTDGDIGYHSFLQMKVIARPK